MVFAAFGAATPFQFLDLVECRKCQRDRIFAQDPQLTPPVQGWPLQDTNELVAQPGAHEIGEVDSPFRLAIGARLPDGVELAAGKEIGSS